MIRTTLIATTALSFVAASAVCLAQDQPPLNFGGSVGIYYPSSKLVKAAFGSSVINYGISPVSSTRPSAGSLTPSLDFTTANKNGNKLFIGTLTYGYEYHLGDDSGTTIPYARVFGGGSYFDYGIDQPGARLSAKRIGYTYGAEAGLVFAKRLRVSVRYNAYSKENIFDFNGITLSASYAVFRL